MNVINKNVRRLGNRLAIAIAGLALISSLGRAATVELWVTAGGSQALIVPGSNTGGRVIYSAAHRCLITDRAARGEEVVAFIYISTLEEWRNPQIFGCWLSSDAGAMNLQLSRPQMFATATFIVPTNPSWDDNQVNVRTVSASNPARLPVGRRP